MPGGDSPNRNQFSVLGELGARDTSPPPLGRSTNKKAQRPGLVEQSDKLDEILAVCKTTQGQVQTLSNTVTAFKTWTEQQFTVTEQKITKLARNQAQDRAEVKTIIRDLDERVSELEQESRRNRKNRVRVVIAKAGLADLAAAEEAVLQILTQGGCWRRLALFEGFSYQMELRGAPTEVWVLILNVSASVGNQMGRKFMQPAKQLVRQGKLVAVGPDRTKPERAAQNILWASKSVQNAIAAEKAKPSGKDGQAIIACRFKDLLVGTKLWTVAEAKKQDETIMIEG